MTDDFDAFLCHNSRDKPAVKRIANVLRKCGIRIWLDEWELRPGIPWQTTLEEQIGAISTAVVFVGENGLGPWQDQELRAFLREFVRRNCPVIPVLLSGSVPLESLPIFLRGMTAVDFNKSDPDPYEALIWGITGVKPFFDEARNE